MATIKSVKARQIFDSRGNPTVEMSDAIITFETNSKSLEFNPNSCVICRVCEKQFSQYTCPRCNVRYCSLHCYKSHSLRCTEAFMRDNVMGELQQVQSNEESKQKMLDILKRLHEEEEADSMDEDDSSLSEETIQKVISGDSVSFNDLSSQEQKHLERFVASGELGKLIQPWDPWWLKPSAKHIKLSPEGTQLIRPIEKQEPLPVIEEQEPLSEIEKQQPMSEIEIPPGSESPIPPINKLTFSDPSPLLPVHITDIIYSYCFALRLYNGDWKSDPLESSMVVLSISSVLDQQTLPKTVFEALSHCLENTCSTAYRHIVGGGLKFGLGLMDDVISVLNLGGDALVCLLCDLQRIIRTAKMELKSEKLKKSRRVELKRKLNGAERKIYFIMCWVHEQPDEAWDALAGLVGKEKFSAVEYAQGKRGSVGMEEGKKERSGKRLVMEV